jgi:carbon-monoxide dehydrogenase medium subunit
MEAALAKNFSHHAIAHIAAPPEGLNADLFASAEYRAHLVGVMASRAIEAAML